MPAPKILITDCDHDSISTEQDLAREHGIELVLAQCHSEDDVIAAAAGAAALVVQYAPITARVLDALPGLKAISRYGVGVDTVDVHAATLRGVAVCNVPDYGTEDVSDHAVALALTLARGTARMDRDVRRGIHDMAPVRPLHRVNTRIFGVVGLGLIGSATAQKAKGLGYTIIGSDPALAPGTVTRDGVKVVTFDELLSRADVVSLHVPLNPGTHHLINADSLSRMKTGAVLINTCRGAVVDTGALAAALASGHLYGAGLDVFEEEPLPSTSPLLALENTVLTPHAAWYSEESYGELKRRTLENVIEVCAGRTPRNILNPKVLV
ncbi:D-3-phosphoglycerate dehydrogenase [Pseudarthrobacter sp. W1I19]|uniref:C-terminal binding protein n=1 Tax=Pseudarthrobacter sp. W1I19 TaxID=3042288 RepID=UPI002784234E|nr:C-terminal binding protein [Pseudarthrobacter sp. W1I19]MDQ0923878.1 D-3-phosphoglycerate dehydrogenase [Pseudarthrobacter sp. W1I19]